MKIDFTKKEIYQIFPSAYNTVSDGKIIVNYGYYVEDLLEIRKAGRLKEFDYLITGFKNYN